eukprot:TRINITY_DN4278_c2_g1_i1.p1 TRINITY_DN4278_c2_g1~~TRINITY_DN4278_c2_g1_i1.p1  ORF type:complete len:354 (+),score=60.99 TRINITY_DN4278_c2_g1_i1:47-1108(+)
MVRWGVLATGAIANDFTKALTLSGGKLQACASRNADTAKEFAAKHGFASSYGSYEELCDDKNIDVIYIATPHSHHYDNIMMCISKGKNILCEKPLCPVLWQTEKVIEAAREAGVFLMEGMWTRFFPATKSIVSKIEDGQIGDITAVNTTFGFKAESSFNQRLFQPELAGGAILDIGIYPIHWTLMLLGEPDNIQVSGSLTDTGVDEHVSCLLSWSNKPGVTASITCSFKGTLPNESDIIGTKGMVRVSAPFHTPSVFTTRIHDPEVTDPLMSKVVSQTHEHQMEPPLGNYVAEGYNFVSSQGFIFEIQAVEEALQKGLKEHPDVTHERTLAAARVVQKIIDVLGVKYPFAEPK